MHRLNKESHDMVELADPISMRSVSGTKKEQPSMKNYPFSPFKHPENQHTGGMKRVGVPGYSIYKQTSSVLRSWSGTSFQEVMTSGLFKAYSIFFLGLLLFFSLTDYNNTMRAMTIHASLQTAINRLCVFTLTFFMTSTVSKVNTRFENVCKTNGYVTRLTALAGALYPPPEAEALMRYTNSIMHVYYFLMSGPMDKDKWQLMIDRGLLNNEEVEKLQLQGSPGVVLYSWSMHILKFGGGTPDSHVASADAEQSLNAVNSWAQGQNPLQLNMEACIGGTRGLAAKQIAYTLFQTPMVYFHAVYVSVNVYLLVTCWSSTHAFARAVNEPCHIIATHPVLSLEDDNNITGSCISNCAVTVLFQMVLIFTFLSVLEAAEKLSDAYGPKVYHYDLGVDLDNLWNESKNVLKSMHVPRPKIRATTTTGSSL